QPRRGAGRAHGDGEGEGPWSHRPFGPQYCGGADAGCQSVVHHDHVATVTGCRRVAGFVQRKHPLRLGLVFRTRACKIITGESEVVETRLVIGGFLGGCRGSDTELRVPGCTDLAHHTDLERSGPFGGESRGDEDAAPGEAGNDRITPVVAAQLRGEFDPGTVAI